MYKWPISITLFLTFHSNFSNTALVFSRNLEEKKRKKTPKSYLERNMHAGAPADTTPVLFEKKVIALLQFCTTP